MNEDILRDLFAGMALQGMLADSRLCNSYPVYASTAYHIADLMMLEREKSKEKKNEG